MTFTHTHTLSLKRLSLLVLLPEENCVHDGYPFSSPSSRDLSRDSCVEVSSIRLGEAVKRLTTQLVFFSFFQGCIFISTYMLVVVVVVVLPMVQLHQVLIGCCQQNNCSSFSFPSLDRWQHFRQDRIQGGINQYTCLTLALLMSRRRDSAIRFISRKIVFVPAPYRRERKTDVVH